jgi:glycosyltransferase involved in cell wall biosynthesis
MGYPTGVALAHFCRGSELPMLVRCAGQDIQTDPDIGYGMRLNPEIDRLVRRWLPQVPLLVAITESVTEEYRSLGVPDERIVAIPNGVNLARFSEGKPRGEVRQALGLPEDAYLFLSVARNHPKKNQVAIIEAGAVMKDRQPNSDWAVAIAGKDTSALMPRVQELGLEGKVHLIEEIGGQGEGEDGDFPSRALVDLYRSADVFVFPSLLETFGIAIVEAMAAGLPVIVGDSPGCRDIVQHGRYGLMVPPKDISALADAMERVMNDQAEAARLRKLSAARAKEYDWDGVVDRYLAAYERLLEPAR